ncbi:hypothetical protein SAMN04488020_12016 [Palleronia marisminoris]|uniref:Uncharacterized protein n=1 Tax=Palleronia marisminoris TaxID=315423 RepID=A0A1Y5TW14_9RHOB|nr:hypothetical protein [Palleronia marisminoris]SFH52684.1 hypothetical protein SAMN04488020_12016 [Palleronia marisminoris]SLN71620.1 hypothetical protein PAM7066_03676 [Palleronia marisminoris]
MPDLCLDNLDHFIADAISTARIVIVALGEDAIPHLPATRRSFAKDVRGRMNPDRLFETQTIFDLDGLIEVLETAILSGTHEETIFDNSLENVSTTGWTRRHYSPSAEALGRALIVILHLRETLQDIRDLRDTQRVLNRMHAEP